MDINWIAIAAALIAGLSTGIGALPVLFKKDISKKTLDLGMGFSAGIMLVAAFISLLLPALESGNEIYGKWPSIPIILISLFVGYLFILGIHEFFPHEHLMKKENTHGKKKKSRVILIVLSIALHNIPEGLAVGVGFGSDNISAGLALAAAISIQNIPEGLVVAFGLIANGASRKKAFSMALLSGLIEPIAAILGFISTQFTSYSLPIAMSFAAGTMLFVTCQELFPELFREGHEKRATLGVILGIMTMIGIDNALIG